MKLLPGARVVLPTGGFLPHEKFIRIESGVIQTDRVSSNREYSPGCGIFRSSLSPPDFAPVLVRDSRVGPARLLPSFLVDEKPARAFTLRRINAVICDIGTLSESSARLYASVNFIAQKHTANGENGAFRVKYCYSGIRNVELKK